ncbi:MAG: 3'(2'),5'-bisphosphate nucleotidase CysQ [Gammaproteobacteria bacterium]|nr:3'(2'),5'-bisphosphate nucleotidase CysQ [Gammaproteobacteria bacterium]
MRADLRLAVATTSIALAAAAAILERYAGAARVQYKDDRSPVTDADLIAHEIICRALEALEPGVPLISEEGEHPPPAERAGWHEHWLVDPLDGTRSFVAGRGDFSVNIALVSDHRPVLGVIAVPVNGCCYYAARGAGARVRHADGATRTISTRRLADGRAAVLRSRSRLHRGVDALCELLGSCRVIRASSALKACLVAQGTADLYAAFGATSHWDTAAAQCLLEEAGGALTDLALAPLAYDPQGGFDNPYFLAVGDPDRDWAALLRAAGM